jgi:hypothetical protein
MLHSFRIRPPNSILFIVDPSGETIPAITRDRRIWATDSCICVGCLMEQDGPTDVTVGPDAQVAPPRAPAFDGVLRTPSRIVQISTSERTSVFEAPVENEQTRVRIWTNHPSEPDEVIIGLE